MGITKFVIYVITLIFVSFPAGVGTNNGDHVQTNTATEKIEILPLNTTQVNTLDSLLQRRLKRNGFRGTALVSYKNQVVMEYAHGYADYRSKEKINVQSTFQLASVSKSITATAIMILKEKEALNFNDLVQKHIPEFPYEGITVKQLLQHTGGMQNYMYLVDNYWKNDSLISNEDVLDLLIKHDLPLNNKPGSRFLYSNTGYTMLALLVERISEQPFGDFVSENIFKPCGMDETYTFNQSIMDTISGRVIGYNRKGRRLYRYSFEPNDMVLGDKSVYSNVNDLFLYQKALNSFQLVKQSTLEEAYTKGITTSRYHRTFNYGYGWRLKNDNGTDLVYHNGLWHGFSSTLTRDVSSDITVILLNNTTASISAIKNDLIKITKTQLAKYGFNKKEEEIKIANMDDLELGPQS